MLNTQNVMATIAVKDLGTARKFYEDKLGFREADSDGKNYISYFSGDTRFLVYKSAFAGGYKATVATWNIGGNAERQITELKRRGIIFEHYDDMPGTTREGDLHISGPMKNAWCKDPDGNILCFVGT